MRRDRVGPLTALEPMIDVGPVITCRWCGVDFSGPDRRDEYREHRTRDHARPPEPAVEAPAVPAPTVKPRYRQRGRTQRAYQQDLRDAAGVIGPRCPICDEGPFNGGRGLAMHDLRTHQGRRWASRGRRTEAVHGNG